MKIRRYYGHDCDSMQGFNNGYYIDEDFIKVKDIEDAYKMCKDYLKEYWNLGKFENDEITEEGDDEQGIVKLITGYFESELGNEISYEEYMKRVIDDEASVHYRYVYVAFSIEVTESIFIN